MLAADQIAGALDAELTSPPKMVPPDSTYSALIANQPDVAQWAYDRLITREFIPTPEETVAANKGRHGVRPIAVWDLPSKLAYRALVAQIEGALPPFLRSRTEFLAFQRRPLDWAGTYIVAADIAACYQHLDHGLVLDEVAVQTGEHDAIDSVTALLREASGRSYGLPQQSHASDVLAEALLAKLERALVRRGLAVARYSDDFRFSCVSWSEVIRALEILEEEARRLGLTINDSKTLTWGVAKYQAHLDEVEKLRLEIAKEAELDLTDFDSDAYDGTVVMATPDPDDVELLSAFRVLDRWEQAAGRGHVSPKRRAEHRATVELLPYALSTMALQPETPTGVLDQCMRLLRYERTLTPAVATYLTSRQSDSDVIAAFDKLLRSKSYLNGWQAWWLQAPLARVAAFATGDGATRRLRWARAVLVSAESTPVLRGEAARTLARHARIDVGELLALYDRSSNIVRPVLAGGMALLKPSKDIRSAVVGDSKLNEWAYDWAAANA